MTQSSPKSGLDPAQPPAVLQRLLDLGLDEYALDRAAREIIQRFDRNRKQSGQRDGPIGALGCHVYDHLIAPPGADGPHWRVFSIGEVISLTDLCYRAACSVGAGGKALNRLVAHGFVERTREGRSFRLRALLPSQAALEWADGCIAHEAWAQEQGFPYNDPDTKVLQQFRTEIIAGKFAG